MEGTVAEDAVAAAVGEMDLAEFVALNARDTVVPGEVLVEEGEVGVQQGGDRQVLADDVGEQHFGLPAHRILEALIEAREGAAGGLGGGDVAQAQPLAGEIRHELAGARAGDQAVDFRVEPLAEFAAAGELHQPLVRHAAPEEIRQAGGEGVLVNEVDTLRVVGLRLGFFAVKEGGRNQHGFQGEPHAAFDAFGLGEFDELEVALDLAVAGRAAEGLAGEEIQHAGGVGAVLFAGLAVDEDPAVAFRLGWRRAVERAGDPQRVDHQVAVAARGVGEVGVPEVVGEGEGDFERAAFFDPNLVAVVARFVEGCVDRPLVTFLSVETQLHERGNVGTLGAAGRDGDAVKPGAGRLEVGGGLAG